MITKVKGTQDFTDLKLFNFIVNEFKSHAQLYHMHEITTPILEPIELFKRSLGQHTDVVTKEMFALTTESGETICLRPEMTASAVRTFVENGIQTIPWKVFSVGPLFRHERPQKGRYRQFHQINIEVIGSADISQDVQLIKMLDRFFHEKLSLETYVLRLNFLGCPSDREGYLEKLTQFLMSQDPEQICKTCLVRREKNPMRIFDCKNQSCKQLYESAPVIADHLCTKCEREWTELKDQLHLLSVSFIHDQKLVRGLDYYSKTAFEFVSDNLGAQNAFCGGGRYDQLVTQLGGKKDQPSIGAAFGIERLILLLEPLMETLPLPHLPKLQVIAPLSEKQHALALLLADELQAHDLCVDILFDGGSIKSMMRKIDKMGASHALILGDSEQEAKTVMVKNMITGAQEQVPQIELASHLQG